MKIAALIALLSLAACAPQVGQTYDSRLDRLYCRLVVGGAPTTIYGPHGTVTWCVE